MINLNSQVRVKLMLVSVGQVIQIIREIHIDQLNLTKLKI